MDNDTVTSLFIALILFGFLLWYVGQKYSKGDNRDSEE